MICNAATKRFPAGASRGLSRELGQPGQGVTPAKKPCGWHGLIQGTTRRDRRSEAPAQANNRSHPVGVSGTATLGCAPTFSIVGRSRKIVSFDMQSSPRHLFDGRHGMECPRKLSRKRCAKMNIRERIPQFAHTDAAVPPTPSPISSSPVRNLSRRLPPRRPGAKSSPAPASME
jgi:hypothetical protein